MAKSASATAYLPNGDRIDFTLDGLAMADQIDKLIRISSEMLAGSGNSPSGANNAARATIKRNLELNKKLNESTEDLTKEIDSNKKKQKSFGESIEELDKVFSPLAKGNWQFAFKAIPDLSAKLAFGVGAAVGSLTGYADNIKDSLQRGVSGNIFDIAIAAKTAGLSIGEFNKALGETGGSFAALGTGATDGAKQFGLLVGGVRDATKSVGNLGMSNDQIALLTAQQVKVAIAQGFKGKQAQEVVVRNTRTLGEELDNLANRTGKSTLELAQAAAKLAQDPIVANFVRSAKQGSSEVSAAVQTFTASISGLFGAQGEKIATDALQSALSGLPMVVTQTGKNMVLAGSGIYTEIERQAQRAARGEKVTDEDRARLREMIVAETKSRSAELNQFAILGGSVGESAKQLLEMAKEAENYNSAENVKRRAQDKTAQEFNSAVRDLQANLQALSIPFLKLLNNIDWGAFISVIGNVIGGLNAVFSAIGSVVDWFFKLVPGLESAHGVMATLVGGLLGFGAVIIGGIGIFKLLSFATTTLKDSFGKLLPSILKFKATIDSVRGMSSRDVGYSAGKKTRETYDTVRDKINSPAGKTGTRIAKGLGAAAIIGGVSSVAAESLGQETTGGKLASIAGTAASWGSMGMMLGPKGALAGAVLGGIYGGFKEFFGNSEEKSAKQELQDEQLSASEKAEKSYKETMMQGQAVLAELRGIREEAGYGNQINSRGVSYAASTERHTRNMQFSNG